MSNCYFWCCVHRRNVTKLTVKQIIAKFGVSLVVLLAFMFCVMRWFIMHDYIIVFIHRAWLQVVVWYSITRQAVEACKVVWSRRWWPCKDHHWSIVPRWPCPTFIKVTSMSRSKAWIQQCVTCIKLCPHHLNGLLKWHSEKLYYLYMLQWTARHVLHRDFESWWRNQPQD